VNKAVGTISLFKVIFIKNRLLPSLSAIIKSMIPTIIENIFPTTGSSSRLIPVPLIVLLRR